MINSRIAISALKWDTFEKIRMKKYDFNIPIYNGSMYGFGPFVFRKDIEKLPIYDEWVTYARGSTAALLPTDGSVCVYLHDWENFLEYLSKKSVE